MNFFKFFLPFLFLFTGLTHGIAQSGEIQKKAADRVEALNERIVAGNTAAALSDEQKTKIQDIYLEMEIKLLAIRKSADSKEEKKEQRKALHKLVSQHINKDILTKEQRLAKRKAGE